MKLWGLFRFGMNAHNSFFLCGYSFQNASGIPKGRQFLWLWVSNRGEECHVGWGIQRGQSSLGGGFQRRRRCLGGRHPTEGRPSVAGRIQRNRRFRGTRLCPQSLVCYTFGDRGWRKGVVRGGNKHFPSATEQADSASSRMRSPGVCDSRIRLFGCRWCGGAERISEEILGAQQHHRGSQRDINPPSRRSDVTSRFPFRSLLHMQGCRNPRHRSLQRMLSCSTCKAAGWRFRLPA